MGVLSTQRSSRSIASEPLQWSVLGGEKRHTCCGINEKSSMGLLTLLSLETLRTQELRHEWLNHTHQSTWPIRVTMPPIVGHVPYCIPYSCIWKSCNHYPIPPHYVFQPFSIIMFWSSQCPEKLLTTRELCIWSNSIHNFICVTLSSLLHFHIFMVPRVRVSMYGAPYSSSTLYLLTMKTRESDCGKEKKKKPWRSKALCQHLFNVRFQKVLTWLSKEKRF